MIGVAPLSGTVAELHDFVRKHGITYPTLVDPREKTAKQYGLRTFPLSVLIDRRGVVRSVHSGFRAGEERLLEERIRTML